MEIWQAYSVEQTVYFESQTDRVLIYVQSTAVIVLKYRGILSLDCFVFRQNIWRQNPEIIQKGLDRTDQNV